MKKTAQLFDNFNACEICKRPLPESYTESICPACKERQLFHQVRDFIRANNVNEYQVAEHFGISIRQVKGWIREGRIEYKEDEASQNKIEGLHCERCGAPVSFGSLCPKCLKLLNTHGYQTNSTTVSDKNKMRYLEQE